MLDVLEEGVTLLGGEKFSTGSVVLPFLNKLKRVLEVTEDDPVYIAKFKRDLGLDLERRCDANLNEELLRKASFFDKRYFSLKFLSEEERVTVLEEIRLELKDLEEKAKTQQLLEVHDKVNQNPPKKRRLLGSLSDSDDEEEVQNAEAELASYQAERKLKGDGCPFSWWRDRRGSYPLMSRLARKYLSVQATSTPAERVMSTMGIVLEKKRQAMTGELFSEIMFLSDTF